MSLVAALVDELDDAALDALAGTARSRLATRLRSSPEAGADPWLDSAQAAAHLCCSRDRVHDLVQLGKLSPRRDGRRLRFRRSDLDRYLEDA